MAWISNVLRSSRSACIHRAVVQQMEGGRFISGSPNRPQNVCFSRKETHAVNSYHPVMLRESCFSVWGIFLDSVFLFLCFSAFAFLLFSLLLLLCFSTSLLLHCSACLFLLACCLSSLKRL